MLATPTHFGEDEDAKGKKDDALGFADAFSAISS